MLFLTKYITAFNHGDSVVVRVIYSPNQLLRTVGPSVMISLLNVVRGYFALLSGRDSTLSTEVLLQFLYSNFGFLSSGYFLAIQTNSYTMKSHSIPAINSMIRVEQVIWPKIIYRFRRTTGKVAGQSEKSTYFRHKYIRSHGLGGPRQKKKSLWFSKKLRKTQRYPSVLDENLTFFMSTTSMSIIC